MTITSYVTIAKNTIFCKVLRHPYVVNFSVVGVGGIGRGVRVLGGICVGAVGAVGSVGTVGAVCAVGRGVGHG